MRVGVFGAGGIGAYFGGRLAQAGVDVTLIARGRHLDVIRSRGLAIESIAGDVHVRGVRATHDPSEAGVMDAVLMTTKTWQLEDAARDVAPMIGPDTLVVGLLNGVEAADVIGSAIGAVHVAGGLCRIISYVASPGVVRHVGADPTIVIGELDHSESERCRGLAALLDGSPGVTAKVSDQVTSELWRKFLFISAMGGVGAATQAPIGVVRSVPQTRELLLAAMHEAAAVGRARGVELGDHVVENVMGFVDSLPPAATSSMQRDLVEGRRSELDAHSGAVIRLGAEVGVATPVHRVLYASLLPLELRARGTQEW